MLLLSNFGLSKAHIGWEISFFDIYQSKESPEKELPVICIKIVSNF